MRALDWARARTKTAQINDSSRSLIFSISNGLDINKLYRYITTFNVMNITIKNIAINTEILWRHPVLGQSEIVFTVAISDVQVTQLSACVASTCFGRRQALGFRRGALIRTVRAHIVERTSGVFHIWP